MLRALDATEGSGDARADTLLDDVLAQLERVLAQVHDAGIRERITRNVPWWREAVAERDARAAARTVTA